MSRTFQCPECGNRWTMPDPGHNQPVIAVCACPQRDMRPGDPADYQVMTEVTVPHVTLRVVPTGWEGAA